MSIIINDKNRDLFENEEKIDFKVEIRKYAQYWYWFVATAIIAALLALLYLKLSNPKYNSYARVKVIDDKQNAEFSLDVSTLMGKSSINLENEIAVFTSFRLVKQVVNDLNLNISYFIKENLKSRRLFKVPFTVTHLEQINPKDIFEYDIKIKEDGYIITNKENKEQITTESFWYKSDNANFPINVMPVNSESITQYQNSEYSVTVTSVNSKVHSLLQTLSIEPDGKDSDIIKLSIKSSIPEEARAILNKLINVYAEDGILDKQEVSKRTINFVDERFKYLLSELDSIEKSKETYKQINNISVFDADANAAVLKKSTKDESLFNIETQVLLTNQLKQSLRTEEDKYELLPSNIGLQSATINELTQEYNNVLLEYEKLKASAGSNNPSIQLLDIKIKDLKSNINKSIAGYLLQLNTTLNKTKASLDNVEDYFESIPQKEKTLRNIDRQQNLKEELYLLLLQKREEAAINLAVTVSNLKIIDLAITDEIPVSPKKKIVLFGSVLGGLLLVFAVFFLKFELNTKVFNSDDIEAINKKNPVLAEIPNFEEHKNETFQQKEVFKGLVHSINFVRPKSSPKTEGYSLLVTSAIKGEGKTFVAYNLATTLAELNKKVILIGADFRNPQLQRYSDSDRKILGITDYLYDQSLNWHDLLIKTPTSTRAFDLMLTGAIHPNPSLLLSNDSFELFLKELKTKYEYIILDSAPTLLVTDTLLFSQFTDTTIYVTRSGFTDKKLVEYSKGLIEDKMINNAGYLINGIALNKRYDYNYGYGYGYNADSEIKKPWYKKIKL